MTKTMGLSKPSTYALNKAVPNKTIELPNKKNLGVETKTKVDTDSILAKTPGTAVNKRESRIPGTNRPSTAMTVKLQNSGFASSRGIKPAPIGLQK